MIVGLSGELMVRTHWKSQAATFALGPRDAVFIPANRAIRGPVVLRVRDRLARRRAEISAMSGAARRARRMRDRQRCVLGIDVGGTSIRAGLFVPRSGVDPACSRDPHGSVGRRASRAGARSGRRARGRGSRQQVRIVGPQGGHRRARARRPGRRDREPRNPAVAIGSSPQGVRCVRRGDHRVRCAGSGLGRSAPRRGARQSDVPVCRRRHGHQLDPVHRGSALSRSAWTCHRVRERPDLRRRGS